MELRTDLVEDLMSRLPQVPREAVIKEDLLRGGLAFDDAALTDNENGDIKPKSYFIFSFDHRTLPELGTAALRRPPEEIVLTGGPHGLRRTVVSVRTNPDSPYRVRADSDGLLRLFLDGRPIADVGLPPMPAYYRHTLANGKSVMEVAPTIQWGYLIYLTAFRVCQYFGAKEECQYCDINHNWRQHKKAGRPYTGVKPVDEVLEALEIIDRHDTDRASRAYTLTGGSITSHVGGLAEADFYGQYAQAIEERFPDGGSARSSRRPYPGPTCNGSTTTESASTTPTTRCGTSGCSSCTARARSGTSAGRNGTAASSTPPRCSARAT
ncbi:hypothetical protein GCM10027614_81400 [Micromonospora vulcania]